VRGGSSRYSEADNCTTRILLLYVYPTFASPLCSDFPHGISPWGRGRLATQGAAFTREERAIFGLEGMIPYEIHDLTKQSVHKAKAREMGFGGLT
jgi:hypothetical protein